MQPRSNRLTSALILIALLMLGGLSSPAALKVGEAFPDLAGFKFEGQLPAELKGKVILVDFWASWCGPCKKSFPVMDHWQKKYGAEGLVIIAVNEDEKSAAMTKFLSEFHPSFAVVRDAGKEGSKLVEKVDIGAMPSSFILGRDGKVAFTHSGFHEENLKACEQELQSLLEK